MCPSNARRQPIILNDKEKAKIDKDHPGSYSHAIHYGSDPDKKYWYICPRYWSLKDGVSLTQEDVDSDKYGIYKFISDENKLSQIKQVRDIQDNIFELLSEVENETFEKGTILPFDCNTIIVYGRDKKEILNGSIYNENKTNIQYEQCEMTNENQLYINCVPRKTKEIQETIMKNVSRTGEGGNLRKSRKRRNENIKKHKKLERRKRFNYETRKENWQKVIEH